MTPRFLLALALAGYAIDLVVEGANDRRLAVELDGDKYHTPEQWTDDLVRQRTMERMGWRFWRCWGSSYYLDPDSCIDDLVQTLDSLSIEPLGGEALRNVYTEHRVVEAPKLEALESAVVEGEEQQELPVFEVPTMVVETMESHDEPPVADLLSVAAVAGETAIPAPSTPPSEAEIRLETIEVGDRVLIAYNDDAGRQRTIRISATEDNPDMGIIRAGHPLAKALIGAAVDEELEIPAGGDKRIVTVVGIEKDASKLQVQEPVPNAPLGGIMSGEPGVVGNTRLPSIEREAVAPLMSEPLHNSTEVPEQPKYAHDFAHGEEAGITEEALTARKESRALPPPVAQNQSIQPYQAWNQHPLSDPRSEPLYKIADQLVEIIEAEGPVLLHRAFHLYADAAGIKRIGNQLRPMFLQATEIGIKSGRVEAEEGGDGKELGLVSIVRSAGSPSVLLRVRGPRTFEEIPSSETKEVIRSLFESNASIGEETLYRGVLDFFDLKRLTSNVRTMLAKYVSEEGFEFTESNTLETDNALAEPTSSIDKKYDFEILGERYSENTPGTDSKFSGPALVMTYKNSSARALYNRGLVVVLAGSTIMSATFSSLRVPLLDLRESLHEQGKLTSNGDGTLTLSEVIRFDSQSGAAQFIAGCSVSGNRDWRIEETGEMLGVWLRTSGSTGA